MINTHSNINTHTNTNTNTITNTNTNINTHWCKSVHGLADLMLEGVLILAEAYLK